MTYAIIQTLFVYGLLTIISCYLLQKSYRQNRYVYMILALLIYATVFGFRYSVGVDCMSYVGMYNRVASGYEIEKEQGFIGIMKVFSSLELRVEAFMGFCAFIQLFFIFHLFKSYKEVYPYLFMTFMMGGEFLVYSNVIRSMFAFAIVVYSLKYVQDKQPIKHYLLLLAAFFIHKSCALMVIVYPLYLIRPVFFDKKIVQYILLVVSLVLMGFDYVQEFISQMDSIMAILGYDEKYRLDDRMDMEKSIGLGFLIELSIVCIIIFYSSKIKEYYTKLPVNIMYDLFLIGILIKYSFIGSMLIQRMNAYFIGYTFILAAMVLRYVKRNHINKGWYLLFGLYCLLAFAVLYRMNENSGMFIFDFQKDLFYLKNDFNYEKY